MAITPGSIDAGVGIGEIFIDKYRVDGILGHGGMGVVALCTHLALGEQVAIKMLRRDVLDDADAVERFMREAQAASKLKSEYVARVTDVGRSRNNVPYMVMEYLEGHDLGDLLDERRTLGQPWAIELTLQACEALAEAHSLGIVHRDVKPTNLFVTWRPDGSALVKVLDFGISKALTGSGLALTQTQSLLGTPAYMSPEQMRSAKNVDARTDIWSLGTVLFEMLEGRRPFEAESFSEMCVKVAVDPPGEMTQTPAALQQVVLRCLEKAPEQRYLSMAELARDLVPFASDPHQAQVLVDRMTRTLRRSQAQPVEWTSSSPSGPMQKVRSGERPAEGAPSESAGPLGSGQIAAAAPPAPAGSGAAIPRVEKRSGSGPAFSQTLAVTRPGRRSTLLIAGAVIIAAAIGVSISLFRSPAPAASPPAAITVEPLPPAAVAAPASPPTSPPSPAAAADPAQPPADRANAVAPTAAADRGSATDPPGAADRGSAADPAIAADRGSAADPAASKSPGQRPIRPGRTVKPAGNTVKATGDAAKAGGDAVKRGAAPTRSQGGFQNCAHADGRGC